MDRIGNRFFGPCQKTSQSTRGEQPASWPSVFRAFMRRKTRAMRPTRSTCTYLSSHAISYNLAQSRIQHACAAEYMHDDTGSNSCARAVPSDHDPRAGHHSAGPGPSGTTSSPPGTAGDALPTLQARACARGAQAVSARRPGGCRRGHRRRLARRTDATRAAAAAAALAGRCVRARLLTTAPALPHAAPAPSHTPHVLHVVVWPMETGASRHLALVHRQQHLGDARVGGPPHVKPEHKPRGAHKHDSEQDYAGFRSGTADGRRDSAPRALARLPALGESAPRCRS